MVSKPVWPHDTMRTQKRLFAMAMPMDVLNPWMLAGMAGVLLPVLIHLLARRRLPIIDWGAMQFLQTSPYSRRSFSIDDWLLLLFRMLALALLAVALARPWIRGNLLGWTRWSPPRDVSVVIDGSFSTAVPVDGKPLHEELRNRVRSLIGGLSAGSTVQLFDVRDAVVPLMPHRSAATSATTKLLQELQPPTGSSNLPAAILIASRDLLDTGHVHRDVIVFADDQSRAWRPEDLAAWSAVDGQWKQAAVPPRVSVILSRPREDAVADVGWEQASIARERLVPGQTVTVQGQLKNWSTTPQQRRVGCLLNGRPIAEHQTTVRLPPGFTTPVSFEVRLPTQGQHALSLRSEADALPGNDHVEFVAEIVTGVKVLLVDGTPADDPLRSEIFFAKAALENAADTGGWVNLTTMPIAELTAEQLSAQDVVVLANVSPIDAEKVAALEQFVTHRGAVIMTLGDQSAITDEERFTEWRGWLPVALTQWHDPAAAGTETHVDAESLTLPWLERFRPERGGELCDAAFRGWWSTSLPAREDGGKPQVLARFANGDPWLISARHGRGTVVVATSTLDADGNTLPARPDYVAWLHELILAMSEPPQRRNVGVGEVMHRQSATNGKKPVEWFDPWGTPLVVEEAGISSLARWPGIYVVATTDEKRARGIDPQLLCGRPDVEVFAAQSDGAESDRTPLTDADRATIAAGRPLRFYDSVDDWQRHQAADAPRSELGWSVLWFVLGLLMTESLITRRRANRAAP